MDKALKHPLGELCNITKGTTGIQKAISGEFPLVVTAEERKTHNEYQFDDEAVIVPLVSGTGHGHASIKRIHYQEGKFALGSILCAIIPKDKSILNAEYLFRFLNLNKDNELVARMRGMANVTLPIKEIAKIEIPLPSLVEQLAFIEKYKTLETDSQLIEVEFQNQLSLVKQLRQSFLSEAMQGKLCHPIAIESELPDKSGRRVEAETGQQLLTRIKAEKAQLIKDKKLKKDPPTGRAGKELPPIKPEDIPFEIPEDWVWCRLGEIVSILGDGLHGTPEYSKFGEYHFVNGNNLNIGSIKIKNTTKKISYAEFEKYKKKLTSNTVLVSINGSLGNFAFYNNEKIILGKSACYFNLFELVYKYYIGYIIQSKYFLKYASDVASQTTIKNVSLQSMREFLIPLPPLSIQIQIVSKLDSLMKTCDDLETSIKQSQLQNEQLLQQILKEALEVEEEVNI